MSCSDVIGGPRPQGDRLSIDPEQAAALKAVKQRDGVPESEQIRRAIDAWLKTKWVKRKVTHDARLSELRAGTVRERVRCSDR